MLNENDVAKIKRLAFDVAGIYLAIDKTSARLTALHADQKSNRAVLKEKTDAISDIASNYETEESVSIIVEDHAVTIRFTPGYDDVPPARSIVVSKII